ncbi:LSU ribosomal protein L44E [Giardia duodenalis]|uniref:LSU ribosomal protein L44E n=1 Tax=Giardia intestinalis TaxID=5741 RepID=V6TNM0_GIAIN|nr:LSU ribosomal protein L44E [Giardia intestinalis]
MQIAVFILQFTLPPTAARPCVPSATSAPHGGCVAYVPIHAQTGGRLQRSQAT